MTEQASIVGESWRHEKPPPHLMMNYRIVDDAGQELAMSGDLGQLKAQLGQAARSTLLVPIQANMRRSNVTM